MKILQNNGFKYIPLRMDKCKYIMAIISYITLYYYSFFKFKKDDTVIVQYPVYSRMANTFFYKTMFNRFKGKLILLIHDIIYMREKESPSSEPNLKYLLERSDYVIVHTENMKEQLIKDFSLCNKSCIVLNLFDYLTDEEPVLNNSLGNTVIFAGNLKKSKSSFIQKLSEIKGIKFNLYGKDDEHMIQSDNCFYKGCFSPENISFLEGDWGLVWDGNSIETCAGNVGEYLRLNSSHKTSLYITAGKPVIVWKHSGLARFIEDNDLGIAVETLSDIVPTIQNLSDNKKTQIVNGVLNMSKKLRNGSNLSGIINKIMKGKE